MKDGFNKLEANDKALSEKLSCLIESCLPIRPQQPPARPHTSLTG